MLNNNRYNVRLNILFDWLYILNGTFQSLFFQILNYDLTLTSFEVLWNVKNEDSSLPLSNYPVNQSLLGFPRGFKV
jgi:hypothetical protein